MTHDPKTLGIPIARTSSSTLPSACAPSISTLTPRRRQRAANRCTGSTSAVFDVMWSNTASLLQTERQQFCVRLWYLPDAVGAGVRLWYMPPLRAGTRLGMCFEALEGLIWTGQVAVVMALGESKEVCVCVCRERGGWGGVGGDA